MSAINESEIQELAKSPREIGAAHGSRFFRLALSVACILVILWLAHGWLPQASHWMDDHFQKEIARRLGISSGAIGFLWYLVHTFWQIFQANKKKKEKRAEEEKEQFDPRNNPIEKNKQFNPRYNPIAERDSESWSHERHNA